MNNLEDMIRQIVREEIARSGSALAIAEHDKGQAIAMTINQLRTRYGIGRSVLLTMIESGELPATTRTMRGGHAGYVVNRIDADRILAGINHQTENAK